MRPKDDIHKLIKKLQFKASIELDRKVHDDISRSLAESETTKAAAAQPNIWRTIMKSPITKLAIAAAILIAFGIGFSIGRWSKPAQLAPPLLDVTSYTSVVPAYPTARKSQDSFWRQKAIAAMQPRPYAQTSTTKTNLLNAYKQYIKEKHYD